MKSSLCLCRGCFHVRVGQCKDNPECKDCCDWNINVHKWLVRLNMLRDDGFNFFDAKIRRPNPGQIAILG
jgi:hypothetical protein